jgi:hypothetical protein
MDVPKSVNHATSLCSREGSPPPLSRLDPPIPSAATGSRLVRCVQRERRMGNTATCGLAWSPVDDCVVSIVSSNPQGRKERNVRQWDCLRQWSSTHRNTGRRQGRWGDGANRNEKGISKTRSGAIEGLRGRGERRGSRCRGQCR